MDTVLSGSSPTPRLFSKTRQAVLALFFGHPDEQFYLRQVAQLTGAGLGSTQRELRELTAMGILRRMRRGMHVYFQVDVSSPIFGELRGLVTKTIGIMPTLRDALKPLESRISLAFIFGSVARGEEMNTSDVDVMVVGDVSLSDVVHATSRSESILHREVNPTVYTPEDLRDKIRAGHHFLTRVFSREKLFLIGTEDDAGKLLQGAMDCGSQHLSPGNS